MSTTSMTERTSVTPEEREQMIAVAAYYRAERRGFAPGDPLVDWLEAEAEIDGLLAQEAAAPEERPPSAAMDSASGDVGEDARSAREQGRAEDTAEGDIPHSEERRAFEERFAEDLRQLAGVLETLRVRAEVLGGRAREEMERAFEAIGGRELEARRRLDALRSSGQEAWRDLRAGAERAWSDLRQAIESARQRFR